MQLHRLSTDSRRFLLGLLLGLTCLLAVPACGSDSGGDDASTATAGSMVGGVGGAATGGTAAQNPVTGGSGALGPTGGASATGGTGASGGTPPTGGVGGTNTGGALTGGTGAQGGSLGGDGGTSGSNTGGMATGGMATGGMATGGMATGGMATGGMATGGSDIGGAGGSSTGGAGMAGSSGASGTAGGGPVDFPPVVTYPTPPGAVESSLYTVTVNDESVFVERLTKFSPQMQVHYAHCSVSDSQTATVAVTVNESFTNYTLSPKSRNLNTTRDGNTITFDSGPNYLILKVDSKELLFILLDPPEVDPPQLGDPDVRNIADYGVDNTGQTLETSTIQSAIDDAAGSAQNILYFPPGRYQTGELWLRSNMTLYLAGGALLYGSNNTGDFNTGNGGINIEGCSHGVIRMYQISNTQLLGRGVIDGNGLAIRAQNDTKVNLLKIEQSSDILVDGILVRDSSFWNTLIYRSDAVTLQNYKMINCRPNTDWNNTDGVDFDESTNGVLYNAFLYTGDDSMATKNEEPSGTVNTENILHEKVVAYSNSVGCKIGTKTMGQSMDGVVFRDIDVVRAGRALTLEGYDTAVVRNTTFEDVRVESADIFIKLALDEPPDWRSAANSTIYQDTYFTNVSSDDNRTIILHGRSGSSGTIDGVHFSNLTIRGNAVTGQTDPDASWNIANGVTNITFQ